MAIGLIGLTCLGLLGLGAVFFLIQTNRAQEEAVSAVDVTPFIPTPLPPTDTPLPPPPTDTATPPPTPTATLVVRNAEGQEAADGEQPQTIEDLLPVATSTSAAGDVTPTSTLVVRIETATPVSESESASLSPPGEMPPGGGVLPVDRNSPLVWAGILVLVTLIVGVIARLRST